VCSTFAGHTNDSGNGDEYFTGPHGVAVDSDGNVYVADTWNERVKVCTPAGVCSTFAGKADQAGDDNTHFDSPRGVAVDSAGNVYVADSDNYRVQKCTPGGTCSTLFEASGGYGDGFDQINRPQDVAVDAEGRVYVADIYNQRVQVFDSSGAYLTTIGGQWGSNNGELRHAASVAVDDQGNVYIADELNARIQKFAPGVPGWKQVNVNGFGYRTSYLVGTLASFDNRLYAGMYNPDTGAQLWRKSPGASWTTVFTDGLGDTSNVAVDHMIEFGGELYLGTWNQTDGGSNGGQIWRSKTGDPSASDWDKVASRGFTSTNNSEVFRFVKFDNQLYAATWNPTTGGELWRSSTGNSGSWVPVMTGGFDDVDNNVLASLTEFNGVLYAGTYNDDTGAEVWRSFTGTAGGWTQVNTDGFGDAYNRDVTLEPFNGYLYAGIYNYTDSDNPGAELWRCQQCSNPDDWEQVAIAKGFGDTENRAIRSLVAFDGKLYAFTINLTSGIEVWQTTNGTVWEQVGPDGLGDSNNWAPYWDNSTTVFNDNLYVGTWNPAHGGEVWLYLDKQVFLPLVLRNF
jgi:streptogramin lyase